MVKGVGLVAPAVHAGILSTADPLPLVPCCSVQESLALPQNPASQGDAIRNAFVLLGFFIFLRVLVYVVLRRKTARL